MRKLMAHGARIIIWSWLSETTQTNSSVEHCHSFKIVTMNCLASKIVLLINQQLINLSVLWFYLPRQLPTGLQISIIEGTYRVLCYATIFLMTPRRVLRHPCIISKIQFQLSFRDRYTQNLNLKIHSCFRI